MKYTTLNEIKKHEPCRDGWQKLLTALGKTKADDKPVSLKFILESNGLDDALWALRAVADIDRDARLFAVWCARQVQHLMTDKRCLDALDVAERFANGKATQDELTAASDAAMAVAWDAAWDAARGAARGAARDAARDAQKTKFIEMFCQE